MSNHFYIHIPFCGQKCPYCKFALTPVFDETKKKRYIAHLKNEIKNYFLEGWEIRTIYFGGGTPSILSHEELREILECFPDYKYTKEITLEANPEDITEEYVSGIFDLGINRLSIGIQTLNNTSLKEIHRSNKESIYRALENIKNVLGGNQGNGGSGSEAVGAEKKTEKGGAEQEEAYPNGISNATESQRGSFSTTEGFGTFPSKSTEEYKNTERNIRNSSGKNNISINIDFILGLPYTKKGEILEGIKELHKNFPFITHTSVYMLEDDKYPKDWKENSLSENEIQEEFLEIMEYFESLGWNHYELSNWARPGYESIHNQSYWDHSSYRGFGLSASSYEDKIRFTNASSFSGYYEGKIEGSEKLNDTQIQIEEMMFGLRRNGWKNTNKKHNQGKIDSLILDGLIKIQDEKIHPTKTGIFLLDHIMSELI